MPYIKPEFRKRLAASLDQLVLDLHSFDEDEIEGVLNYTISVLLLRGLNPSGLSEWKYRHHNRAAGILDCISKELYRRQTSPYEDKAIETNGDVL